MVHIYGSQLPDLHVLLNHSVYSPPRGVQVYRCIRRQRGDTLEYTHYKEHGDSLIISLTVHLDDTISISNTFKTPIILCLRTYNVYCRWRHSMIGCVLSQGPPACALSVLVGRVLGSWRPSEVFSATGRIDEAKEERNNKKKKETKRERERERERDLLTRYVIIHVN